MKKVKSYSSFLLEKETLPEQIVSLVDGDSYAQTLVTQYCVEIDHTVDLVTALSLLSSKKQEEILSLIKKYRLKKNPDDAIISTHTDLNILESNTPLAGKNLFYCFLKVLTALGQKNIQTNWESTPDDFLLYFLSQELEYLEIRLVTSRFKYLDLVFQQGLETSQFASLYFGLKTDMTMEFGIKFYEISQKIGEFKLTEDTLISFLDSTYLALNGFKSIMKNFNFNKLKLLSKIKKELINFQPGYYEQKTKPVIKDDVITFGYIGIGTWDNGFMDNNEYESVKTNLRNYLIKYSWVDDVKMSVVTKDLWVYINLKPKDL
jgi:hypothetical protein